MSIKKILQDEFCCKNWQKLYEMNLTPWDTGKPAPALVDLIKSGIPNGRALVPGCGRGHDVYCLASNEREAVGIDIHDLKWEPKKNTKFIVGDFFKHDLGTFDFVFDYTFFCAIPPEMRLEWGNRMRKLVKKGGMLACLMFPLEPMGNPPYQVCPQDYSKVLGFRETIMDCRSENRKEKLGIYVND